MLFGLIGRKKLNLCKRKDALLHILVKYTTIFILLQFRKRRSPVIMHYNIKGHDVTIKIIAVTKNLILLYCKYIISVGIAVGDKNSLGGGEQNLPEYFLICPNMTDLVGKFHVINYLN